MAKLRADGTMKISNREFEQAVEELLRGIEPRGPIHARIMAVAVERLRQRRRVGELEMFAPATADVIDVIRRLDARQLHLLKKSPRACGTTARSRCTNSCHTQRACSGRS